MIAKSGELGFSDRTREIVALKFIYPQLFELFQLRQLFDSLGHHLHPQLMGEINDGSNKNRLLLVLIHIVDKGFIYLQFTEFKVVELVELRPSGSEIIECKANFHFF